jgi:hypothetical protein
MCFHMQQNKKFITILDSDKSNYKEEHDFLKSL